MPTTRLAPALAGTALLALLALTGCASGEPEPGDDLTPAGATSTPSATSATSATTEPVEDQASPPLPVAVDAPVQGGTYGAVVLAAGDPAALEASQAEAAASAYTAYTADTGCLQGLSEALALAEGTLVSHLLFEDLATAQQFADGYAESGGSTVGVAEVRAYCLD